MSAWLGAASVSAAAGIVARNRTRCARVAARPGFDMGLRMLAGGGRVGATMPRNLAGKRRVRLANSSKASNRNGVGRDALVLEAVNAGGGLWADALDGRASFWVAGGGDRVRGFVLHLPAHVVRGLQPADRLGARAAVLHVLPDDAVLTDIAGVRIGDAAVAAGSRQSTRNFTRRAVRGGAGQALAAARCAAARRHHDVAVGALGQNVHARHLNAAGGADRARAASRLGTGPTRAAARAAGRAGAAVIARAVDTPLGRPTAARCRHE